MIPKKAAPYAFFLAELLVTIWKARAQESRPYQVYVTFDEKTTMFQLNEGAPTDDSVVVGGS